VLFSQNQYCQLLICNKQFIVKTDVEKVCIALLYSLSSVISSIDIHLTVVSQKSSLPPKIFCDVFTEGERM